MNAIKHRRIIIDYYVWEPYEKLVTDEETNLFHLMKEKKLLNHAGYVKAVFEGDK